MLNLNLDLTVEEGQHLHQIASAWNVTTDEAAVTLLRHGLDHMGQIEAVEHGDIPTGFGMLIQLTDAHAKALAREAEERECSQEDLMWSAIYRYAESLLTNQEAVLVDCDDDQDDAPPYRLAS